MRGSEFAELTAFVAVAEQRSFSKAAVQLGMAASTLSETIRSLEERLGVRLFNRTTRSVASTEAGERLLANLLPALDGVGRALDGVNAFRDKPSGTLRIATARSIANTLMAPVIAEFLARFPEITLEVSADDHIVDIVSARFDAGIRIGEMIEKDMIALRLTDPFPFLLVASPDYLAAHAAPQEPEDLHTHSCIRFRTGGDGGLMPWTFDRGNRSVTLQPAGRYIVNDLQAALLAACNGIGLAYLPAPLVQSRLESGEIAQVMPEWRHEISGIFVFYSSRRQIPAPLQAFVDFLKSHRADWQAPAIYKTAASALTPEF
jgi:DNA-binding transcriptional LysR family regulator